MNPYTDEQTLIHKLTAHLLPDGARRHLKKVNPQWNAPPTDEELAHANASRERPVVAAFITWCRANGYHEDSDAFSQLQAKLTAASAARQPTGESPSQPAA